MTCKQCNIEFKPKRADTLFCSANCRKLAFRSKLSVPNGTDKPQSVTDNVGTDKLPVTDEGVVTDNPVTDNGAGGEHGESITFGIPKDLNTCYEVEHIIGCLRCKRLKAPCGEKYINCSKRGICIESYHKQQCDNKITKPGTSAKCLSCKRPMKHNVEVNACYECINKQN